MRRDAERRLDSIMAQQTSTVKRRRNKTLPIALLSVVVVASLAVVWRKGVRDYVIPKNFGVVDDAEVYRSGALTPPMLREVLANRHIKTVIDFGAFEPASPEDQCEQEITDGVGATRFVMRLNGDGRGNPNAYVQALRFMTDPVRKPILVHCAAGAQRTGAAILLYRVIVEGWSLDDAYREAQHYKHDPRDDWPMLAFAARWLDEIKDAYTNGGWIDGFSPIEPTLAAPSVDARRGRRYAATTPKKDTAASPKAPD